MIQFAFMPWISSALLLMAGPMILLSSTLWPIGAAFALIAIGTSVATRRNHGLPRDEFAVLSLLILGIIGTIVVSTDWLASLPRVLGLLFAAAVYVAVRSFVRATEQATGILTLLSGVGLAIGLVGLVGTDWRLEYSKVALFLPFYDRLPRLISSVPSSQGTIPGFHPNEVAAICALLVPIAFTVAGLGWKRIAAHQKYGWWIGILAFGSIMVLLLYIVLSVSRAAWVSLTLGLVVAAIMYWRKRGVFLVALLGLAATGGWFWLGQTIDIRGLLTTTDFLWTAESWGRPTRYQMWGRAVTLIGEHPLFGIGPNMFPQVAGFELTVPGSVPHAHNMYLQVALDFGLLGLGMFVVMLLTAIKQVRTYASTEGPLRLIRAGLAGSLVVYLVFGLVDAVAVGAKPTFIPWTILALAASMRWSDAAIHLPGSDSGRAELRGT